MALDKIRISNQIRCLEVTDARHLAMDIGASLAQAHSGEMLLRLRRQ